MESTGRAGSPGSGLVFGFQDVVINRKPSLTLAPSADPFSARRLAARSRNCWPLRSRDGLDGVFVRPLGEKPGPGVPRYYWQEYLLARILGGSQQTTIFVPVAVVIVDRKNILANQYSCHSPRENCQSPRSFCRFAQASSSALSGGSGDAS